MAFIPIDENDIEVGKPTKKRIFQGIKDNFDDHEERINSLQAGATKVEVFNFEVFGEINDYNVSELVGVGTHEAPTNYDITNVSIQLQNNPSFVGSSLAGDLEIDVERSLDNGNTWFSILDTRASIVDGVNATGAKSSNAVINATTGSINQGDLVRVNVTSLKQLQGSFIITVYGEI